MSTEIPDGDPAPDHDVRALLRITPFRRLWLALGLSSLGDWLGLLATAALAGSLASGSYTSQNFAVAGVFLLRLAPAVVLGPLAGALADRFDRRWTLVFGDLARFALFVSIVLVGTLPWLYVATVLIECVALFWGPANDATIPNLVPRRRLEAANQVTLVATYGSAPIAAALYTVLALIADGATAMPSLPDVNPITVALWANAITFLISALVIWRLDFPPMPRRSATRQVGVIRSILDGWRFVASTPVVRGLVLGMLGAFAAGGFVVGLAQTFVGDLGAGQPGFGVLFGAVFVGLAGGMWIGPLVLSGLSRRRLFGLALVCAGVFLLLLALVPNMTLAIVFTVGLGLCGGVAWVTGYTLLGLEVDDEVRGRTFGLVHSSARVVLVLVLAIGPALAALVGRHTLVLPGGEQLVYNGASWVFGLAGLLAIAMGITAYRQMDDRPGVKLHSDLLHLWSGRHEGLPARSAARSHNGWFIAFEGGDGTGKSTQARVFADWLRIDQGHDVVLTREPGATAIGVRLREVLLGEGEAVGPRAEALLFAADRAHHVDSLVKPALARGAIVITDRYVDSSIAYQGAGRALDADEIAYISRWATGGLVPDLTVLLDIPPEISRIRRANDPKRSGADRLEAQPEEFHQRVRERFLELARKEPQRYLVLDGSDPREEIQEAIRRRVRDVVPISRKRRAELAARLAAEEDDRNRRAGAEAEVLRLDAELRGRSRDEARARQEATRRAREEADRQLQEEANRQYEEESRRDTAVSRPTPGAPTDPEPHQFGPPPGSLPVPPPVSPALPVPVDPPSPPAVAVPAGHLPTELPVSRDAAITVDRPTPEEDNGIRIVRLAPAERASAGAFRLTSAEDGAEAEAEPSRRPRGGHALSVPRRAWFTNEPPTHEAPDETAGQGLVETAGLPADQVFDQEADRAPDGHADRGRATPWLGETERLPILTTDQHLGHLDHSDHSDHSEDLEVADEASEVVPDPSQAPTAEIDLRDELFGRGWGGR